MDPFISALQDIMKMRETKRQHDEVIRRNQATEAFDRYKLEQEMEMEGVKRDNAARMDAEKNWAQVVPEAIAGNEGQALARLRGGILPPNVPEAQAPRGQAYTRVEPATPEFVPQPTQHQVAPEDVGGAHVQAFNAANEAQYKDDTAAARAAAEKLGPTYVNVYKDRSGKATELGRFNPSQIRGEQNSKMLKEFDEAMDGARKSGDWATVQAASIIAARERPRFAKNEMIAGDSKTYADKIQNDIRLTADSLRRARSSELTQGRLAVSQGLAENNEQFRIAAAAANAKLRDEKLRNSRKEMGLWKSVENKTSLIDKFAAATAVVEATIAKANNGSGVLTNQDVIRFTPWGQGDVGDRLIERFHRKLTGRPTDEEKRNTIALADALMKEAKSKYDQQLKGYIASMNRVPHGRDPAAWRGAHLNILQAYDYDVAQDAEAMMGETPPDTREVIPTAVKSARASASRRTSNSGAAPAQAPAQGSGISPEVKALLDQINGIKIGGQK
jgi:hypothetical protein